MGALWAIIQRHIDSSVYAPSERRVAERLGVSPTTLGNWRDPKNLPRREHLEAIASLAGVPYDHVLDAALLDIGYRRERGDGNAAPIVDDHPDAPTGTV